ncbi:hypothetical protein SPD48_19130 [Pseudogracilibacillus sp. SE30717A]|uniref:hypothetical protein n=1 Tax=Pseudogracilibacillus sp. SE30717A TaxID=3098293 RepID=UPI00300E6530
MISNVTKLKFIALAAKYGVQVEHFVPGEVVISIATWRRHKTNFFQLMDDLRNDPNIYSITFDETTGFVYISYDHSSLNNKATINNWLHIFKRYSF